MVPRGIARLSGAPAGEAWEEPAPDERAATDEHRAEQPLEQAVAPEPVHPEPLGNHDDDDEAEQCSEAATECAHRESVGEPGTKVPPMVSVHVALGVAAVVVCFGAAVVGLVAYRRKSGAGPLVAHALALAQTLLIAQAGVGLLLLSDDRRAPDRLHYTYGGLALGVALSPWFYAPGEGPRRLLWFAGTTFLAGALAVRAFMTGGL